MDNRDIRKAASVDSCLALYHELSERLTAAESYFTTCQHLSKAACRRAPAQPGEVLEKALSQLAQARQLVHRLRPTLTKVAKSTTLASSRIDDAPCQALPSAAKGSGGYRICFLNQFARGAKLITACQRSIVIRSAKTREDAIEEAKKRFAELEGVPNWQLHATMIEVGALDEDPRPPT